MPLAAEHEDPGDAEQVHVTPVSPLGMTSVTDAPRTADGPLLVTTTLYVTASPGNAVTRPSVLVIERSATGVRASLSLAVSFAGFVSTTPTGSVTVALLTTKPAAAESTSATTTTVTTPPTGKVAARETSPEPLAVPQVAPLVAEQLQVDPTISAGNRSVIWAPSAVDGPLLATVIVYVVDVPGTTVDTPSVLVIDRSTEGVRLSTSVDELSEVSGSTTPMGSATVTVLVSKPVASAEMVAVSV